MSHNMQELKIKNNHIALILISIVISTILIRVYFYPFDLPITHDGDNFFSYALDTSILNSLPENYTLPNNGWPLFLSLFFKIFQFDSALGYMDLQRILSITISVGTIIPMYFLCRRFFSPLLSLIGGALFGFSPQIIQNSLLGVTEPLYIFLVTVSISLFLSKKPKMVYCSFWIIALASIVRYEGIVLVIPFSIMFFFKFQNKKAQIPKYIIVITIFILILLPIAHIRNETIDNDGFSNVIKGPQYIIKASSSDTGENYYKNIFDFLEHGIVGLVKYLGWSSIPYFLILIPFGIICLFRNIDHNKKTIILISIFLLLPAFYAYSREFQEMKYVLVMFPIFSFLSLYLIQFFIKKIKQPKKIFVIVLSAVLCSSILWVNYQLPDYDYERESLDIAHYIFENTDGINHYYPEAKYLIFAKYELDQSKYHFESNSFPTFSNEYSSTNIIWDNVKNSDEVYVFNTVEEYIKFGKSQDLTHIVTNGHNAEPEILNKIFFNQDDYPYLEKTFDSFENNFEEVHIKIFKINFKLFDKYDG